MQRLLFLGLWLATTSTPSYAAHVEGEEFHLNNEDIKGGKPRGRETKPEKPASFMQRVRNFKLKNFLSALGKKPTTLPKQTDQPTSISIQIDPQPKLDPAELEKIDELVNKKRSTFQQDRTEPNLSKEQAHLDELRSILTKISQQERIIDTAFNKIPGQDEDLTLAKQKFQEAKEQYLREVVKKDSAEQMKTTNQAAQEFANAQKELIKKINEALTAEVSRSLKAQEEALTKMLKEKQFASIKDTDDHTQTYYLCWERAKNKLLQVDEKAGENGNASVLQERVKIDQEIMKELDKYKSEIISSLANSTRSSSAKRNWEKMEKIDEIVQRAEVEASHLSDQWSKAPKEQQDSQAGKKFQELYKKIQGLRQGENLTNMPYSEKTKLIEEKSWFSFSSPQPEGSLKRMIDDLKLYLKQMRTVQ